jgi:MFS family permease
LLADSVPLQLRGRAFGMHRAADHAGAVIGPLIAFVVLREGLELRTVFLLAAAPGVLAVAAALFGVRETREGGAGKRAGGGMGAAGAARGAPPEHQDATSIHDTRNPSTAATTRLTPPAATSERVPLPRRFWAFLGVLVLFTLGNSSDAFLLLRAGQLGVPLAAIPLLWALLHVVKSATSIPGGALSDRVGRRPLIVAGWVWYAAVYLGFAVASSAWHAWALFALYGVMFGLTEGTEKAFIADLAPSARRGSAFGWYNFAIGIAALPASLLFGAIWDRLGARTAFLVGGSLALAAALGALLVVSRPSNPEPA